MPTLFHDAYTTPVSRLTLDESFIFGHYSYGAQCFPKPHLDANISPFVHYTSLSGLDSLFPFHLLQKAALFCLTKVNMPMKHSASNNGMKGAPEEWSYE